MRNLMLPSPCWLSVNSLNVAGLTTRPQSSAVGWGLLHLSCIFSWAWPNPRAASGSLPEASHHRQGCEGSARIPEMVPKMVGKIWKWTQMCPIFHGPIPCHLMQKIEQIQTIFFKNEKYNWLQSQITATSFSCWQYTV